MTAEPLEVHARLPVLTVLAVVLLGISPGARAFAVYPFDFGGETLYLKWGDNHAGTPGGDVTWSIMPAGTPGSASYCGNACPGLSLDTINVEIAPGGGFQQVPLTSFAALFEAAFDRWTAVSGIRFVRLPSDAGLPINDPGAAPNATGHIRIGVFAFASGGGAVGYAPPPNGGTGAGDILFDANSFYQIAPGNEGDPYDTTFAPNDLASLFTHELGHALGLDHPVYDGSCPVMQVHPDCRGIINRVPDADDAAGTAFLYGHLLRDGFEG